MTLGECDASGCPYVPAEDQRPLWRRPVVLVALALGITGVGLLAFRDVPRGLSGANDLSMVYAASRAWLHGSNPYEFEDMNQAWVAGGNTPLPVDDRQLIALYPPATYLLLFPLGALPWELVRPAWAVVNLLAIAATAWLGVLLARRHGVGDPAVYLIVPALVLVWGPNHTNQAMGQTSLVPMVGVLAAWYFALRRADLAAGVVLGLATAIKPQMAGLFVVLALMAGRWRLFGVATVTGLAVLLASIGRMELAGVAWLPAMRNNLHWFGQQSTGDPSDANALWHLIMNLPVLLHRFTNSQVVIEAISWLVTVGALAIAWTLNRQRHRRVESLRPVCPEAMLMPAVVGVVSLLPVYHRFYDGMLLLPAAFYVVTVGLVRKRWPLPTWLVALGLAVFIPPNMAAVLHEAVEPRLPAGITTSWSWAAFVSTHQVWAMLVVLTGLLWALNRATWDKPQTRHR